MTNTTIASTFQLGTPTVCRGIAIAPLFPRRDPDAAYTILEDALPRGFRVTETSEAGDVPELLVENPLIDRVLLYDGEELVGAKQNRILNVTVLVDATSKTRIPVSCVEAGRWQRRSAAFAAAEHSAGPELRRRKARALEPAALARGVAQGIVWDAIAETSARLGVHSPTSAHGDLFADREPLLGELGDAFAVQPGQSGIALLLPDGGVCVDYLSRPAAYAAHHRKLLNGYLLDALGQLDRPPASVDRLEQFVGLLAAAKRVAGPSPGLGRDLRISGHGLIGSGLGLEGELLQLSAYSA